MQQNKVGKIIEKSRKAKKLTQKELAELLGVSNTAISKWENGNNLPDISMLEPLCEVLGLDLLELISVQNTTHEDTSKKFTKIRKTRIIRNISVFVIFLSILCLTNVYTYNKLMIKRKTDLQNQTEVYRINSKNEDYIINGYLIFNNKENLLVLEELHYQIKDKSKINYNDITTATYIIKIDNITIFKRKMELTTKKYQNINEILSSLRIATSPMQVSLKDKKADFNKIKLTIKLIDKSKEEHILETDLQLKKEFI